MSGTRMFQKKGLGKKYICTFSEHFYFTYRPRHNLMTSVRFPSLFHDLLCCKASRDPDSYRESHQGFVFCGLWSTSVPKHVSNRRCRCWGWDILQVVDPGLQSGIEPTSRSTECSLRTRTSVVLLLSRYSYTPWNK